MQASERKSDEPMDRILGKQQQREQRERESSKSKRNAGGVQIDRPGASAGQLKQCGQSNSVAAKITL